MPISFIKYIIVGSLSFVVDTGSFMGFLSIGLKRPISAGVAFTIGTICHFTLNRLFSFQNFDREIRNQLRTYLIVAVCSLFLTVGIIEILSGGFGLAPIVSKILAVCFIFPVGFLGHKYLSFGQGIRKTFKKMTSNSN